MIRGGQAFKRTRSACCLLLAVLFFVPAFPMPYGGLHPARAESVWRTDTQADFNSSGSSISGCFINGTGSGSRIELARSSDWFQIAKPGPSAREGAAM
jgi:hypothetical protein